MRGNRPQYRRCNHSHTVMRRGSEPCITPLSLRGAEGSMHRNRIRNLIAGQGLPFETLCIERCLTAVVGVTDRLPVGPRGFVPDPRDPQLLPECPGPGA